MQIRLRMDRKKDYILPKYYRTGSTVEVPIATKIKNLAYVIPGILRNLHNC